ncbi:kinase-like domain-containing protein [Mycena galopus ATCC 62051]|nr:kinase-like domain-containing protein [Mycena galopus ATCC 62051]
MQSAIQFAPTFNLKPANNHIDVQRTCVMDAVRISDGKLVMLKQISKKTHPFELEIGRFFSSQPRAADPRNHCIPLLDVLQDPKHKDIQIIVMPRMVDMGQPKFDTVGEVVDCFRQIFEGLQFMHENYVAHRDCNRFNIVVDPEKLYPQGFHPVRTFYKPDMAHGYAKYITRTECWPRYYLIDFGISRQYNPDDGPPLEPIIRGADDSLPEFVRVRTIPESPLDCNPFPTDIYYLGHLLSHYFVRSHIGFVERGYGDHKPLHFLKPLVDDMMHDDPSKRPTIGEVIERFEDLGVRLNDSHLRQPGQAVFCHEWITQRFRQVTNLFKHVPPLPAGPSFNPNHVVLDDRVRAFYTHST